MSERTPVRITISPEPTEEEKAAIAAAVVAIGQQVVEDEPKPVVNRWREAGRREAMRSTTWEKTS